MHVPCLKGHTLTENNPFTGKKEKRFTVSIYNDVCDSTDLCKDQSCPYYDNTKEGNIKYHAGLVKTRSSVEGMYEDKKNEKEFLKKHNLEKVEIVYSKVLEYIYKLKPDLVQSFLDDYYKEKNIPPRPFDGDFKKLYKMLTRNGELKVIIPKEFMNNPN